MPFRLDLGNADIIVLRPFDSTSGDGNAARVYSDPADALIFGSGQKQGKARAMIQPSGSGAQSDSDARGWIADDIYSMRLTRADETRLGPLKSGTRVCWDPATGKIPNLDHDVLINQMPRWAVVGEPRVFAGSSRTAHIDYTIVRR